MAASRKKDKGSSPALSEVRTAAADSDQPSLGSDVPPTAAGPADATPYEQIERIVAGHHHDPHSILGAHVSENGLTVRVLRPFATSVTLVTAAGDVPMDHEHEGVWVARLPEHTGVVDYRLAVAYGHDPMPADDPYHYLPTVGEMDLHLIREGRHELLWEVMGAHMRTFTTELGTVSGVSFAVWAPNAQGVRVVGDFNGWDGRSTPMRSLGSSGIWELFIPYVNEGVRYKYEIVGRDGVHRTKADPYAFRTEVPPSTASLVWQSKYEWGDHDWMSARASQNPHNGPMSTYEVHLGSWRLGLSYRELAHELVDYTTRHGFTHVEFLPVMEHPYAPSWGYQVTGYWAPTSRFGNPDDFKFLVDQLHQAGVGVILDWVPAHFPKDDWALARFDGTTLFEHADPQRGEHPDWGTLIFDFGRNEVRNFLVANAVYWCQEFHADGLRVDAVASMLYLDYSREAGQWTPNEFGGRENLDAVRLLQEMNATVYRRCPGVVTIAEESTSWPGVTKSTDQGGLGFGLKWNMGWMHDTLEYIKNEPIHRKYHHNELTFSLVYQWSENFLLPISHDEVVHGKGSLVDRAPGDYWQRQATLRAYLGFMWAHPGKKLLFMGSEFGQWTEWSAEGGLDWWLAGWDDHRGIADCVRDMNTLYRDTPALWQLDNEPAGFEWLVSDAADDNTIAWLRKDAHGGVVAAVSNFSPVVREGWRLGLPFAGTWREVLNTDAAAYGGGTNIGNYGRVHAESVGHHGRPASALITVPPLATVWFQPE